VLKFEESEVFEYYSNVFTELEKQDNGYYPSKHDPIALSRTAKHFNISEEEASSIFDKFSKHAAELDMAKIKKLPPELRKRFLRQRSHDLLCNNRDLPFFKIEGEPSEELTDPLDILSDEYQSLVEDIAYNGWTIPISIDIKRFDELRQKASDPLSLDTFFLQYYNGREFRYLCRKTKKLLRSGAQQQTFEECCEAYSKGQFTICRTALISVLEGMISEYNTDPCDIRVMKVCHFQAGEERKAGRNIRSLSWISMYQFTKKFYEKSDFSKAEPGMMNRHWIEHGRTDRIDDGTDCLKLFNAIATMAFIKEASIR